MTTRTLLIISTLTVLFFGSCSSTPDLTEDEVYTIINEIIVDDSLHIDRVCWKFQDQQLTDEYKKEFTQDDISFIGRQSGQFKNLKIKPNKLKWYLRRSKTFKFAAVDTVCDQGIITHFSFPLISADRQKVIIEIMNDCNCMLGGGAKTCLYEKKNGHWVRTKIIDGWISNNQKREEKKQLLVTARKHNWREVQVAA